MEDRGARGIALVGFMGAGKSTVGQALAELLGVPLVDLDQVLIERHGSIDAQIRADGLAGFRARERAAALALCDGVPRVLATGGGTFEDPVVRDALRASYRTVFLDVPFDEIRRRVGEGTGRPLWDDRVADRFAERRPIYALAAFTVRFHGSPTAWAEGIAAALGPNVQRRLRVDASNGGYDVILASTFQGLAEALPPGPAVLVTESTVGPLWAGAVREALGRALRAEVVVAAGEAHKTRAAWSDLCDALIESGVDRGTTVLALGGGVLGDLAGFAAAATLRGLPLVQLPTTLLAMVDSAVGGKVAVNHPAGKNLIGAFHPPVAVWMALETLSTLPGAEVRCGWGEILKTALAADASLFEALEGGLMARALGSREALAEVIERCVRAKARVVGQDERESGPRTVLNAGHTAGHAIEAALGPGTIPHGQAVAIGLVAEMGLAVRLGVCGDPDLPGRLMALIGGAGLRGAPGVAGPRWLDDLDRERFIAAIGVDKKAAGDKIRLPLPVRAGEMRVVALPRSEVNALYDLLPRSTPTADPSHEKPE